MHVGLLHGGHKPKLSMRGEPGRRARPAVRLNACLQAAGVRTEPRDARIDVEGMSHGVANIGASRVARSAAKARTKQALNSQRNRGGGDGRAKSGRVITEGSRTCSSPRRRRQRRRPKHNPQIGAASFQKRKRNPAVGAMLLRWRKPKANPPFTCVNMIPE